MGVGSHPEVVTIGETMLLLAPPRHQTIETCQFFLAMIGGAEANVAIGLERMGAHAAWVGKLPRNALGRRVVSEIQAQGVDTSAVVWSEEDEARLGLYFFEWGIGPRPSVTIYDRAMSSASTLTANEIDWDFVSLAKWVHLTGITPALGKECRAACREMISRSRDLGLRVCFDLNYRSLLWSREEAKEILEQLVSGVDLLIGTEEDLQLLAGRALERDALLEDTAGRHNVRIVVMTCGAEGAWALEGGSLIRVAGHPVEPVNRLGAGDAFAAGVLYGCLTEGLKRGMEYGLAMAAMKMTMLHNAPIVDRADVIRLARGLRVDLIR
jgi:2-dehydro-3-deoxygluconokinase